MLKNNLVHKQLVQVLREKDLDPSAAMPFLQLLFSQMLNVSAPGSDEQAQKAQDFLIQHLPQVRQVQEELSALFGSYKIAIANETLELPDDS